MTASRRFYVSNLPWIATPSESLDMCGLNFICLNRNLAELLQ